MGSIQHVQQIQMMRVGPYPPPHEMREYESILPGAFNRIVSMAEQAQAAQIATMQQAQNYARRDARRGQVLGFITALAAMGGAIWCVHVGSPSVAGLFLSVPVLAVAKALIDSAKKPAASPLPEPAQTPASSSGSPSQS
jgi:uncharacterized membrane protein